MRLLGNLIWGIFGGWIAALCWMIIGLLWCVTVIGIPVGVQCFKMAGLAFNPFGKDVTFKGGAVKFIINVIWFFLGGMEMALGHITIGLIYCVTVVGIPFGLQHFKIAKLAICPFGAVIETKHIL